MKRSHTSVIGTFQISDGAASRTVQLATYLDATSAERATNEANAWIKSLRHVLVDGRPLRDRLTYRGDSLWWFMEVYLAREKVVVSIFKTLAALEALLRRETPDTVTLVGGDHITRTLAPLLAGHRGIDYDGVHESEPHADVPRPDTTVSHLSETIVTRLRPAAQPDAASCDLAVFVHSAFWSADGGDQYLSRVINALRERLGESRVTLVGIGPRTSTRVRRALRASPLSAETLPFTQVQRYAALPAVLPSLRLWLRRRSLARALLASDGVRASTVIHGYDVWPLIRDEISDMVRLHLPWSARAMDEVGAALDRLRPRAVVTYAEAGDWGRAVVLECRRRHIPVVGVQHGFIYRHWLHYLHGADEMAPSRRNEDDAGFPRPDLTLLYDGYAARWLKEKGHFPPTAIRVTGSPELDALTMQASAVTDRDLQVLRAAIDLPAKKDVILIVSKFTEIQPVLANLVEAIRGLPQVHAVIKCHPVEPTEPYVAAAAGTPNLTVVAADAHLAPLLRLSRGLVTVNSTVAFNAMVLGVPALTLDLPNNLSPFVDAGVMVGLGQNDAITPALEELLYDEKRRQTLADKTAAFLAGHDVVADGRAVERTTDAIVALVER